MKVTVIVMSSKTRAQVEVKDCATVLDAVAEANVPASVSGTYLVTVNGKDGLYTDTVKDGDVIILAPNVKAGC